MILTSEDVQELKNILLACKIADIDSVVLYEGEARGAKLSLDTAIISNTNFSFSKDLRIGIGRVLELEKRLSIFTSEINVEGKCNDVDISLLTLSSGRTKVQFRCTSVSLMKYPKRSDDVPFAVITLGKDEVIQISKGSKLLQAETIILEIKNGIVILNCSDSGSDRFSIELLKPAEFVNDLEDTFKTYLGKLFISIIDGASKDNEEVTLILGEAGSLTSIIRGHTILLQPRID